MNTKRPYKFRIKHYPKTSKRDVELFVIEKKQWGIWMSFRYLWWFKYGFLSNYHLDYLLKSEYRTFILSEIRLGELIDIIEEFEDTYNNDKPSIVWSRQTR